jgi:hypothetical protein
MTAQVISVNIVDIAQAQVDRSLYPINLISVGTVLAADIDGGALRVFGTTKKENQPDDIAVSRYVRLHDQISGRPVRAMWSGLDGRYEFSRLRAGVYYLVSFDHTGQYNGVIATNITPEPMP